MGIPRFAAKRDLTEPEIILVLQAHGFHVQQVSAQGLPDLLLSRAGCWYVAECKTGKRGLTPAQVAFHGDARAPIPIFRTVEDAVTWARLV